MGWPDHRAAAPQEFEWHSMISHLADVGLSIRTAPAADNGACDVEAVQLGQIRGPESGGGRVRPGRDVRRRRDGPMQRSTGLSP
jgi:hypothetical protein